MLRLFAQNFYSERMKRADREAFRNRGIHQTLDSILHFSRSLVGKSEREDVACGITAITQQISYFLCNDTGLS